MLDRQMARLHEQSDKLDLALRDQAAGDAELVDRRMGNCWGGHRRGHGGEAV